VRVASALGRSSSSTTPNGSVPTPKRASSSPDVTSSSRMPPGPAARSRSIATARSMTSPTGIEPPSTPRPVTTTSVVPGSSSRRRSAQRAAVPAWSVALACPASVATNTSCASCSIAAPSDDILPRSRASVGRSSITVAVGVAPPSGNPGAVSPTGWSRSSVAAITTDTTCCALQPNGTLVATRGRSPAAAPVVIVASTAATSPASGGRRSRSFSSIRVTSSASTGGVSGRITATGVGSANRILPSTATRCSPSNGEMPVSASYMTQPIENTSERASTPLSPRACSGDMYSGVPTRCPVLVADSAVPSSSASPKSSTLSAPMSPPTRNRFDGLMSRWTTPCACTAAIAPAIRRPSRAASASVSGPRNSCSSSVCPSSHSVTRKRTPSSLTPWSR
jgi:hypothetical protein